MAKVRRARINWTCTTRRYPETPETRIIASVVELAGLWNAICRSVSTPASPFNCGAAPFFPHNQLVDADGPSLNNVVEWSRLLLRLLLWLVLCLLLSLVQAGIIAGVVPRHEELFQILVAHWSWQPGEVLQRQCGTFKGRLAKDQGFSIALHGEYLPVPSIA